jgi:hypothetical protein
VYFKTANCLATGKTPFKAQAPVTAFFSMGARKHIKIRLFLSLSWKWLFREGKKKQ